jgi:rod shape-determining protein MreB
MITAEALIGPPAVTEKETITMLGFSKDIGIDLGTANTLIYMKGKGIIMREPSVVAIDTRTDTVRFVGQEAKDVIGRTPGSIVAMRPLKDGVIADFDVAASMLQNFIKKVCGNSFLSRPNIIICVPSGVTEVERRAVRESAIKAGGRRVAIIEEPMAAAIGAGLPVAEATGSMVVDIGGGTSEVAVISLGGIVIAQSVRVGGDEFDSAIIQYVKRRHNLLIGERTAEAIKIQIGSASSYQDEQPMEIKGRNLVDGLPKNIMISPEEVREALADALSSVVDAIKTTLERTPPELAADIIDRGITLTGGGAMLRGLDTLIQKETGIDAHIAESPLDCVVAGTGRVLEELNKLHEVLSGGDETGKK